MMDFKEYLESLEESTPDEWMTAAAAFIGTLANNPEIEVSPDVRIATLILYARMPESVEDKAIDHIDERYAHAQSMTPEFQQGLKDIDSLLEVVEQGLDPDDLM